MNVNARPTTSVLILCLLWLASAFTWPPVQAQDQPAATVRITLLHLNDVYQAAPVDQGARGGLARVATLRRTIMAESPHTLLLLGGDTISPSVASSIFRGQQMIAAWNAVGLDYAVFGNHEFDFGDDVLRQRIKESRFVWLGANVIDKKAKKPFGGAAAFVVHQFGGIKLGIFGLCLPETKFQSNPGPDVAFYDPYLTARQMVRRLRAQGATVIVALTHMSMEQDKRLARMVPEIDVILGGHEHTLLQSLSGRTPIFKMWSDARLLGRIDLHVHARSGKLQSMDWQIIPVTADVAEDAAVVAVINEYENKLSVELDKVVGTTTVVLDARQQTNRSQETNLGNFIADAFRAYAGADVALVNGGSIRSNTTYGPGAITKRDVRSILPFENPIVKIQITGATLRAALEHGVSRVAETTEAGLFLQVSGLRFSFDGGRPPGSRVVDVLVNGQPLDNTKTYTLATSLFLASGGDGYAMLRGMPYLIAPEAGQVDFAILADAIAAQGTIAPQTEGRIRRLDRPK